MAAPKLPDHERKIRKNVMLHPRDIAFVENHHKLLKTHSFSASLGIIINQLDLPTEVAKKIMDYQHDNGLETPAQAITALVEIALPDDDDDLLS